MLIFPLLKEEPAIRMEHGETNQIVEANTIYVSNIETKEDTSAVSEGEIEEKKLGSG